MKKDYAEIAKQARIKVLDLIHRAGTSHTGSCLSAIDLMAVLFEKVDITKDEAVLSAGWKAAAWYYFLWKKGVITEEELNSFCMLGSSFIGLVEPMGRWGLKIGGGSMGLGFPGAVGLALAKKLKGEEGKVYVLMSDGEMQCGTTWESFLIAKHHNLDNLMVIVDKNLFQAMGKTEDILHIQFLAETVKSIGWMVGELDGHNINQLDEFFLQLLSGYDDNGKKIEGFPWFIIAHTIKGKGVSFMENNNLWHYSHVSKETLDKALEELNI